MVFRNWGLVWVVSQLGALEWDSVCCLLVSLCLVKHDNRGCVYGTECDVWSIDVGVLLLLVRCLPRDWRTLSLLPRGMSHSSARLSLMVLMFTLGKTTSLLTYWCVYPVVSMSLVSLFYIPLSCLYTHSIHCHGCRSCVCTCRAFAVEMEDGSRVLIKGHDLEQRQALSKQLLTPCANAPPGSCQKVAQAC